MDNTTSVLNLKSFAQSIRLDCIELTYNLGETGAHIGGALSLCEIMAVLFGNVLNFDISGSDELRDRVIFSKGHCLLVQYCAMYRAGIISKELLNSYKQDYSPVSAHPSRNLSLGIEYSTGSLGQGLSIGVGCSIGLKLKNNSSSKVYVILGDGECNEGSVWEAVMSASHFNCSNLVAIVDKNSLQYDGKTSEVMNIDSLSDKFKSFGWNSIEVNGHDIEAVFEAFNRIKSDKPTVIIANTIKGKGVSFLENSPDSHNRSLSPDEYKSALKEVNDAFI